MNSIRRRTLTLIIGLLLVGLLILSVFNVHDSNHEIAEVYDAQLAQNARLLQGVMRMPLARTEPLPKTPGGSVNADGQKTFGWIFKPDSLDIIPYSVETDGRGRPYLQY